VATIAWSQGPGIWLRAAVSGTARALLGTYQRGAQTFRSAPLLVALAVVPQFAQHAFEIQADMFDSKDAFRALQMDPVRWVFGNIKVAGLLSAMLLIARFWACGSVRRALLVPPRDLLRLVLLLGATFAADALFRTLGESLPALSWIATGLNLYAQFGLFLLLVAALLGDRELTLRDAFTRRWTTNLFLTLLLVAAFAPAALLHKANHALAFGATEPSVWGLMAFDSVVIGLLASLVGAAINVGYEVAPSRRP